MIHMRHLLNLSESRLLLPATSMLSCKNVIEDILVLGQNWAKSSLIIDCLQGWIWYINMLQTENQSRWTSFFNHICKISHVVPSFKCRLNFCNFAFFLDSSAVFWYPEVGILHQFCNRMSSSYSSVFLCQCQHTDISLVFFFFQIPHLVINIACHFSAFLPDANLPHIQ